MLITTGPLVATSLLKYLLIAIPLLLSGCVCMTRKEFTIIRETERTIGYVHGLETGIGICDKLGGETYDGQN